MFSRRCTRMHLWRRTATLRLYRPIKQCYFSFIYFPMNILSFVFFKTCVRLKYTLSSPMLQWNSNTYSNYSDQVMYWRRLAARSWQRQSILQSARISYCCPASTRSLPIYLYTALVYTYTDWFQMLFMLLFYNSVAHRRSIYYFYLFSLAIVEQASTRLLLYALQRYIMVAYKRKRWERNARTLRLGRMVRQIAFG